MISPATIRRSNNSHQGVRAGVASWGRKSRRMRVAGKTCRFGAGGVTRSNHHSTGSAGSASNSQGAAKPMGPSVSISRPPTAEKAQVAPIPAVDPCDG